MIRLVVDASVVVKWFVPEVHSDAAAQLLGSEFDLFAPDLLLPEVGNILWKKVRNGALTNGEATEILNALQSMPLWLEPSSTLIGAALDLAVATERTVYDSLYVALAVGQGCPLITADLRLYNALQGGMLADTVLWVEDVSTVS